MQPTRKKELRDAYKQREIVGGIYCILCAATGKRWIEMTTDMAGAKNRFLFSVQMNSCIHPALSKDWTAYGAAAFSFEALETVAKREDEALSDYKDGLLYLRDCHRTECPPGDLYLL